MTSVMKELLLIESLDLTQLIEEYRTFFLALLPSTFILAILIEYLDRLEPFTLVKRAFTSILILTSVTSFYYQSIETSMEVADEILSSQRQGNILLMDMFDGIKEWDRVKYEDKAKNFYKDRNALTGTFAFLKYHLFDSFVNDAFTVTIYFITKLCFLILKVVYSLVYYLGYGLIGIPCLLYLFPSMGNVLRGAILSFIWCLVVPHVLVFILSLIGAEISRGYTSGTIIGGSMMGTALLFILTLFVAFTPMIASMILSGSGASTAGGIIASMGASFVMNLPKNSLHSLATIASGGGIGPKMKVAQSMLSGGYNLGLRARASMLSRFKRNPKKINDALKTDALEHNPARITDPQHISNYIKDIKRSLGSRESQNTQDLRRSRVQDFRFSLSNGYENKTMKKEETDAKISKPSRSSRKNETSHAHHRTIERRSEHRSHRHRNGDQPLRKR